MDIIECPKCKFIQPKDNYCANCGINMTTYQVKAESPFNKLIKDPLVHISLLIVVMIAVFVFVVFYQKFEVNKQVSEPLDIASPTNLPPPETPAKSPPTKHQSTVFKKAKVQAFTEKAPTAKEVISEEVAPPIGNIEVYFFEIAKSYADDLTTKAQALSSAANSISLAYPLEKAEASAFFANEAFFPLTSGPRSQKIQLNQPWRLSHMNSFYAEDNETEIGLNLTIKPTSVTAESIQLEIESILALPEEGVVNLTNYNGNYLIPSGHILIIMGIIPRIDETQDWINNFSASPLTILQSEAYKAGNTEFGIVIRPHN